MTYSTAHETAQCYVPAWMGVGFGGEWIHVYIRLRYSAVHVKLSQHCSSAIPQYEIFLVLKKKKLEVASISKCDIFHH